MKCELFLTSNVKVVAIAYFHQLQHPLILIRTQQLKYLTKPEHESMKETDLRVLILVGNSDFALTLFFSNLDTPFTKPHCMQVRKMYLLQGKWMMLLVNQRQR